MSKLQDFGLENPVKKKKNVRFEIQARSVYSVVDKMTGITVQRFIDNDDNGSARNKALEERKKLVDKYGEYYETE